MDWRQGVLIEQYADRPSRTEKQPAFEALRLPELTYVEYGSGEREMYDLRADPQQIDNIVAAADAALIAALSERVGRMAVCAGAACREIESEPLVAAMATPVASAP